MALVDDLVRTVQDTAAVPQERAAATVQALLRLLGARLPSPLYGQLQAHLQTHLQAKLQSRTEPGAGRTPP